MYGNTLCRGTQWVAKKCYARSATLPQQILPSCS